MVCMKLHSFPGLALVLALVLPIGGVVGCQAVKDLLIDPSLPADLAMLGEAVQDCAPLGDGEKPSPEDVAACLDKSLKAAGALADRSDLGNEAMECAESLAKAEESGKSADMDKAADGLAELDKHIDDAMDEMAPEAPKLDMMGDGDGGRGTESETGDGDLGSQGSETSA